MPTPPEAQSAQSNQTPPELDWQPPPIQVQWHSYFAPSAEEQKPVVDMVLAAKNGGLVEQRKAVEAVAQIFGIENVTAYLEKLEEEQKKTEEQELARAGSELELAAKFAPARAAPAAGKPGGPPGGKPAK